MAFMKMMLQIKVIKSHNSEVKLIFSKHISLKPQNIKGTLSNEQSNEMLVKALSPLSLLQS